MNTVYVEQAISFLSILQILPNAKMYTPMPHICNVYFAINRPTYIYVYKFARPQAFP